jgi:hypothetical protein
LGECGGDFVGHCAFAASGDLRDYAVRLMFSEREEQNGLLAAGELGELALEVDAVDYSNSRIAMPQRQYAKLTRPSGSGNLA